jgi:hypothetical protein
MYGPEAVALFSKSGLPQPQLAQIWSMVDSPVDHRLDKLEFAMAMHLIVCVSKKNLPMPPALPMSLMQLRSQQQSAMSATNTTTNMNGTSTPASPPMVIQQQPAVTRSQLPPPQTHSNASMSAGAGHMAAAAPSPHTGGGGMPPPTMWAAPRDMQFQMAPGGGMPSPPMAASVPATAGPPPLSVGMDGGRGGFAFASTQGPPPLSQQGVGGVGISDAFEGLVSGGDTGSISSYRAATPVPAANSFQMAAASFDHSAYSSMPSQNLSPPRVSTEQEAAPEATMPTAQLTSAQLALSYDMGEANEELDKLRGALQKLQAENISLKAKMGTMTDEEHDVQKELNATVAEVAKLASNLTSVRAQVLASKSRLLEASADLKATKEKKGYVVSCVRLGLCALLLRDADSLWLSFGQKCH